MSLAVLLWMTHMGGWSTWCVCGVSLNQKPCITERKLRSTWRFFPPFLKKRSTFCVQFFGWKKLFFIWEFLWVDFLSIFYQKDTFNEAVFVFSLGGKKKNLHFPL